MSRDKRELQQSGNFYSNETEREGHQDLLQMTLVARGSSTS